MLSQYIDWISQNVIDPHLACAETTLAMLAAFPDLKRVRGHYRCPQWGTLPHWWMIDVDGEIIDPTASQFPSAGHGDYEPWDESSPEPTGKCPNCGEYSYSRSTCCSDACSREYARFCVDSIR